MSIIRTQIILALCVFWIAGCSRSPESYVDRGNHFAEAGKYQDAAVQYAKAIQKSPALAEAHYRLGLLDLKTGRPISAFQELRRAVELAPGNYDARARLGVLALRIYNDDPKHPRQLYELAAKTSNQLLLKKPDGFDGNFLKGAVALADKKPSDAVLLLRKAIHAKPDDADAQLELAAALVEDGQLPAGIAVAEELTRTNKSSGAAYDFLYRVFRLSGRVEDAENILKIKVANNPKDKAPLLQLARHYAELQKPAEVAATIEKLTSSPADFPDGRLIAGDFYKSESRIDLATQQYLLCTESTAETSTVCRKRLIPILASQRKWSELYGQIEHILKDQPADEDAKRMRAFAWLDEGKRENLDPAVAELQTQSKKYPQDPVLHFRIAGGLGRKGDLEGVRRELTAATLVSRKYLPARYALVQLYLQQGKPSDALRVSNEITALAPHDPQAVLLHAICLTAVGRHPEARTELNQLASKFPKWPQIPFRLALLDLADHKYKDAEAEFRKIDGDAAKDPEVLAGMAEALEGENQGAKSIQWLQDELKRNPELKALRGELARVATNAGKYDIAIDQYKQLAAATPRSIDFSILLSGAYSAKGDAASAEAVLEKAVQIDPKSALASLLLARTLLATGRTEDAKKRYRLVLQLQPNNASALNDLAYLMADSGENLDQALAYARHGLEYAVNDRSLRTSLSDTLGWIYVKKNMNDSAVQALRPLVRNNPGNASFRYHLGTALYQMGDKKDARVEFEAALSAQPGQADAQMIKEALARF